MGYLWYFLFFFVTTLLSVRYWLPKWLILPLMARYYPKVLIRRPNKPFVCLTIDDVPYGDNHNQILKVLDDHNMKATWFVISDLVKTEEHRKFLVNLVKQGHQLGNHGKTNSQHLSLSLVAFENEIVECDKLLVSIYKEARIYEPCVKVYRPGCGLFNQRMIDTTSNHGYELVLGSVYPSDPHIPIPWLNYWYLRLKVQPGDIIILHDRWWTAPMLKMFLPWLKYVKRLSSFTINGSQF